MPRYSYKCQKCNEIFDVAHSIKEKLTDCPHCEAKSSLKKFFGEITTIQSKNSGKIVKAFIEDTKKELKDEKNKLSKQENDK